jgi:hypothetical protein
MRRKPSTQSLEQAREHLHALIDATSDVNRVLDVVGTLTGNDPEAFQSFWNTLSPEAKNTVVPATLEGNPSSCLTASGD